ncbi:MAG: tetratricopeptide repeat protein [Cyanobacteriota bacterium]|nr:tetratricopeptide repeat protein [Cyanobacteriota bacterium]
MHRRWQSVVFVLSFLLLWGFPAQLVGTSLRMSVVQAQEETREDRKKEVVRLNNEGLQLLNTGRVREALENFQQALVIVREIGDLQGEGVILNNIGLAYDNLSNYDRALEFYEEALPILREVEDRLEEGNTLSNIGLVYRHLSEYDKALDYYQQALEIRREVDDRLGEGTTLNNIGSVYYHQGQYQQALQKLQQALDIRREVGDRAGQGATLNNIGAVYKSQGEYNQALQKFQQALEIAQKIGDSAGEAATLNGIGVVYKSQGEYQQALQKYQQALDIAQEIGDSAGEATTLNGIGVVYKSQGEYQQALQKYQQALDIAQEIGDRAGEATTLNGIGAVYEKQGEYQQALQKYQQALEIVQEIGDRPGEASTLNNIAKIDKNRGKYQQTLEKLQQALEIHQEVGDRSGESRTLSNIGLLYQSLAEYHQALQNFQEALDIAQEIGDRAAEGTILNNIGLTYSTLGKYQKALQMYRQALDIHRKIGNRPMEKIILNNIGLVYYHQSEYESAFNYHQQALEIAREVGNRPGEGLYLDNIGVVYFIQDRYPQALQHFQQALEIRREVGDRPGEGTTLNNIGGTYESSGQYEDARDYLEQALKIALEVDEPDSEAISLSNIGVILEQQNQPELAIVFYKQSVKVTESIREGLRPLPRELQESYTEIVADTYGRLADRLLEQDRILEAQRVLDLLKLQEIEDFNRRGIRGNERTRTGIELLSPEREIWQGYEQILNEAVAVGTELTKIRQTPEAERTPDQNSRLPELEGQEQQYQQQLNDYLDSPPVVALVQQLQRNVKEQRLDLAYLDILQKELGQLSQNGALLYPLVLEDRLELIVTTLDKEPMRRTVEVTRVELNQAIIDFRSALEDPDCEPGIEEGCIDPAIPAQKLYNWLIKPIEADLTAANVETIIYAPDQQLRYIPLAALHDGQQWLIQRWQVNNITALSLTNLNKPPSQEPLVLAGAFSDTATTHSFIAGEESYSLRGLQFAGEEVKAIKSTIPKTEILLNQDFTHLDTLTRGREVNILHLATHAAFVPGYPHESFILFGNGDRATIRDMEQWELPGVELVVLSACETGLNGFGDGVEILGLGYMVQNAGAMAAIATLWEAWDESTQTLMKPFYQLLADSDITKAEALQQAQISLINSSDRSHPYYWAPFLLIGNGL